MDYSINRLTATFRDGTTSKETDRVLQRFLDARIVFSYASEDWPFVEQVAKMLRLYFFEVRQDQRSFSVDIGQERRQLDNVFFYTRNGREYPWADRQPEETEAAYRRRNAQLADGCFPQLLGQADVLVLFAYQERIKAGEALAGQGLWQSGELTAWQKQNRVGTPRTTYLVDFGEAHGNLVGRDLPRWQPHGLTVGEENGLRTVAVPVEAYDHQAARQVAERILRDQLFGQDPSEPPPTDSLFAYEKRIVQIYQEIPSIIRSWRERPQDPQRRKTVIKQLALIEQGLPPFWPVVPLQPDFVQTRDNPEVDRLVDPADPEAIGIGSPRQGLVMLWPVDAAEHDRGSLGTEPDMVVAAALGKYHRRNGCRSCMLDDWLAFPEAGPRQRIYSFPPDRVGIVVSGGIAPGINAVIDGIVHRQKQYNDTTVVLGIHHGFFGLGTGENYYDLELKTETTAYRATTGGSSLMTCRQKGLLPAAADRQATIDRIMENLEAKQIKVLYVIGGDGTMRAAHQLALTCRRRGKAISVVGIPKTMDNDILWVWQSFGFATAVEKARETIEHLATEVAANPRICVLQLFGSASGFVVSHAVLASRAGTCDFALIPESDFSIDVLALKMARKILREGRTIPYGFVVMAESAIPSADSCTSYKNKVGLTGEELTALEGFLAYRRANPGRFPDGQVTNELRSAGLKLVAEGIRMRVRELLSDPEERERLRREVNGPFGPIIDYGDEELFRVFTNEPRHLLRSVPPSFSDVIMGNRLGALAVDNAVAGYTGFMISQWLTEFVLVPLELVALGRKHIPQDGIFWKSVLAKTGQGNLADA